MMINQETISVNPITKSKNNKINLLILNNNNKILITLNNNFRKIFLININSYQIRILILFLKIICNKKIYKKIIISNKRMNISTIAITNTILFSKNLILMNNWVRIFTMSRHCVNCPPNYPQEKYVLLLKSSIKIKLCKSNMHHHNFSNNNNNYNLKSTL